MRKLSNVAMLALVWLVLSLPSPSIAEQTMTETFDSNPEARWRFFSDTVMGGVSAGQVIFETEAGHSYARMTGQVSTRNNGGFIQMRMDLPDAPPADTTGVRLIVRGNDQKYFVHVRTGGTVLPWQYYQAGFDVTRDWTEVYLPFTAFEASGRMLRSVPRADSLTSVAIVAYGRDHMAEIDVRAVGFY
jgi:hypothetical protein